MVLSTFLLTFAYRIIKFILTKSFCKRFTMTIDISIIKEGLPGVSPVSAAHLYEAFMVCMNYHGHPNNIALEVAGQEESPILKWENLCDDTILRTYADMQYTTEHGAVCLAVMLTTTYTTYTVIERSRKGTGFDYWLGDKNSELFQKKARLEVSGILTGDDVALTNRYNAKVIQTEQSDDTNLPAYISIVEFSKPKAIYKTKEII